MQPIRQGMLDPAAALRARTDDAERKMRKTIDTFRSSGRTFAADNLTGFLDGGGADRVLSDAEVERHQPILDAEKENRDRFRLSFSGKTGNDAFRNKLNAIRSGQTRLDEWVDLGREYWDKDYSTWDSIKQWAVDDKSILGRASSWLSGRNDNRGDDDFAVGLGGIKISADGRFQGRRVKDGIEVRGAVAHGPVRRVDENGKERRLFGERYDFNENMQGAREAKILQQAQRATAYDVKWHRPESVSAKLREGSDGQLNFSEEPSWRKLDRSDIDDPESWFRD